MSLDQNLFTLLFTPNKDDPNVTDLVDPSDNAHYRKERVLGSVYKINVYDPLSQSLLATATAPSATSKHKTIELYNPSQIVELKFIGTISFKWRFQWEQHEFEWRREECYIIRKPDPAVLVAVTKEPSGRLKTSSVQILDYNLNRFDIDDRKGLEIVILTALLTFQDNNDVYHTRDVSANPASQAQPPSPPTNALTGFFGVNRKTSVTDPSRALSRQVSQLHLNAAGSGSGDVEAAPALPPKPEARTGLERIMEMHTLRAAQGEREANEVQVGVEGSVEDYARYTEELLKDDAILFVTIRSVSAAEVPKVLQVVEQTKRLRHKAGLDEEEALHQYVVYDTAKAKGPRRIKLDDPSPSASTAYAPPTSLSIHLSKIDMPELQPRPEPKPEKSRPSVVIADRAGRDVKSKKESRAKEKERERQREREIELEMEREQERIRDKAREREKTRKKAEKDAKRGKKGSNANSGASPPNDPEPNRPTRPVIITSSSPEVYRPPPGPPYQRSPSPYQPPVSSYQQPSTSYQQPPSSYHQPTSSYQPTGPPYPMPLSPSFPSTRPTSFYGGGSFPSQSAFTPPPMHPSIDNRTRPASFYGGAEYSNVPIGGGNGYTPGYFHQ